MDEALLNHPEPPLPDDVPTLQRLVRELLGEVRRLRQENARLQQRLDQALDERFGRRSERQRLRVPAPTPDPPEPEHAPMGHGRRRLPAHLERREVVLDLTEAEQLCPCCGQPRESIGVQTSEQLDYDPACLFVRRHVRKVYACQRCAGGAAITTAGPATVGPLPKGLAGPGLLAHLIVSKYDDHLPLNRLEDILARNGLRVPRSTQCDWLARCAGLLRPLVVLMHGRILQSRVIHSDDTPVALQQARPAGVKWNRTGKS
jgi:transposase